MEKGKKFLLVQILELFQAGKNPAQIAKILNISKQNVNYYVGKLKKQNQVEKLGYGTWTAKKGKNLTIRHSNKSVFTSHKKEIRGHAFIWKIEFMKDYDWQRIIKYYKKKKLTFQFMKHNKVLRTIYNNRKIWLTRKGMIIYEPLDFLGKSSFEVKGKAVYEMDQLVKGFLKELGLKFFQYRFTTSREHYGMIKNELARQYNEKGEKMHIRSQEGEIWLWIDDSKSLGELETGEPNTSRQVQNFWNSFKKDNFKVDADFIKENFLAAAKISKRNAENLEYHAENMKTHVGVMKKINKNLDAQTAIFKEIRDYLKNRNI